MLPSLLTRYMFQIRYGCWSLPYGAKVPENFWYHGISAVQTAVLVPSGSPGMVASAVPLLTLLRSVELGVNTPWLVDEVPVHPWQRLYWGVKTCMNRSASLIAPGGG